jgi:hypothetical protein
VCGVYQREESPRRAVCVFGARSADHSTRIQSETTVMKDSGTCGMRFDACTTPV